MAGNTKTAVVAGTVGAVIGSLLTFLALWRGDDAPPAAAPPPSPQPVAAAPAARPAVAEARPRAPTRAAKPAPEPTPAEPATPASPAVESVLEQTRVDVPAAVEASITGFVRTPDGAPVAGAVVRAFAQRGDPSAWMRAGKAPPLVSAAESLTNAASDAKWRAATTRETTTDASGAFAVGDLVDASYSVSAWAEGYRVFTTGAGHGAVKPGATCDFQAKPVIDVPLTVVAADGSTPAERIVVRWSAGPGRGGGGMAYWTAASPTAQIDPGTWDLTAETQAGAGEESKSKPARTTVAVGAPTPPVTLRLEPRNLLLGTVTLDAADVGWDSLTVFLRPPGSTSERPDADKRAYLRAPELKYRFEDVPAGEHEIVVSIDGTTPVATTTARVVAGTTRQDVVVPRLLATQFVEVRVVGPDGAPLAGSDLSFQVKATSPGSNSSWGSGARGRRPDGALLLSLPGSKSGSAVSDPASRWTVEVKSKTYGSKETPFTPGATSRLEVQFP